MWSIASVSYRILNILLFIFYFLYYILEWALTFYEDFKKKKDVALNGEMQ